jgi:hypothetical protein
MDNLAYGFFRLSPNFIDWIDFAYIGEWLICKELFFCEIFLKKISVSDQLASCPNKLKDISSRSWVFFLIKFMYEL